MPDWVQQMRQSISARSRESRTAAKQMPPSRRPHSGDYLKPRTAVCAHPGCDKNILRNSVSGMCRSHNHKPGCRCPQCAQREKSDADR